MLDRTAARARCKAATDAEVAAIRARLGHPFRYMDDNDVASLIARIEQDGERMQEMEGLLRDWCSVPWQHKTDEMLSRTIAALKEAPDA